MNALVVMFNLDELSTLVFLFGQRTGVVQHPLMYRTTKLFKTYAHPPFEEARSFPLNRPTHTEIAVRLVGVWE